MPGENWSDHQIKKALKPEAVKDSNRRAQFAGIEAYQAAVGSIGGDLFAEVTLLDDPEILATVFAERLAERVESYMRDGWKWVDVSEDDYLGYWFPQENGFERIYREKGQLSPERSQRFSDLSDSAETDALDAKRAGGA